MYHGLASDQRNCELLHGFDVSRSAGLYSQLAGVLAGFAFAAIMLLLSRQHRRESLNGAADEHEEDSRFVTGLGCAFVGLVVASVSYAAISAELDCALVDGRAASEMVLAGVAFAFSIYTLLFATVQLLSAVNLSTHLRFIVCVVVPPIVILFVTAVLSDLAITFTDSGNIAEAPLWSTTHAAQEWLPPAVFVVCLAVWWLTRPVRRGPGKPGRLVSRCLTYWPYTSLLLVGIAIWRSISGSSSFETAAFIGPVEALVVVAVCAAAVVVQSLCLCVVRGSDAPRAEPVANATPVARMPNAPSPAWAPAVGALVVMTVVASRMIRRHPDKTPSERKNG